MKELRFWAEWIYKGFGALPALYRRTGSEGVAGTLAWLMVDHRKSLDDALAQGEHWLGPTTPVYVPVPIVETDYPSACGGALNLLDGMRMLVGAELRIKPPWPTDAKVLEAILVERFQRRGMPEWVLSPPTETLDQLAEVVQQETATGIERVTAAFRAEAFRAAVSAGSGGKNRPAEAPTGDRLPKDNAGPNQPKRRSGLKERTLKLTAALTLHHQYAADSCLRPEPIGNNALATLAGVSQATASAFFKEKFDGHAKYRALCRDVGSLVATLKLLNGDFAPRHLYGKRPPGESVPGDE